MAAPVGLDWMALPVYVAADVGSLDVTSDHESTGEVEAVFGVRPQHLVVLTEGIGEHLV